MSPVLWEEAFCAVCVSSYMSLSAYPLDATAGASDDVLQPFIAVGTVVALPAPAAVELSQHADGPESTPVLSPEAPVCASTSQDPSAGYTDVDAQPESPRAQAHTQAQAQAQEDHSAEPSRKDDGGLPSDAARDSDERAQPLADLELGSLAAVEDKCLVPKADNDHPDMHQAPVIGPDLVQTAPGQAPGGMPFTGQDTDAQPTSTAAVHSVPQSMAEPHEGGSEGVAQIRRLVSEAPEELDVSDTESATISLRLWRSARERAVWLRDCWAAGQGVAPAAIAYSAAVLIDR